MLTLPAAPVAPSWVLFSMLTGFAVELAGPIIVNAPAVTCTAPEEPAP
jgi:hypothetical protein